MIPAAFDYQAPTSVGDALALLSTDGDDEVKVLAGGQSLIPVLRLRLAAPALLVDLGRIEDLTGVREDGDQLVIGPMTTHSDIANDPLIREHAEIIGLATRTVADPQVRHRGTIGGAIVHADPAGDLPSAVAALDGELVIASGEGERTVGFADFFEDYFTTAVGENEILTAIRVPKHTGWKAQYQKFTRVVQQWSIVAVGVNVRLDAGSVAAVKIALTNMGPTTRRASAAERELTGKEPTADAIAAAAALAADGTQPPSDANGDADYRRHLATVLTRRALHAALGT
jgi:aerobic carbon-monoxide dehydrogenase medium subunit